MSEVLDALDEWKALVDIRRPFEAVWDAIDENLLPNVSRLAETQDNSVRGQRRVCNVEQAVARQCVFRDQEAGTNT